MEKQYVVEWVIDIWAETPREAAEKALAIQRDPESIATCFQVIECDSDSDPFTIDLMDDEDPYQEDDNAQN